MEVFFLRVRCNYSYHLFFLYYFTIIIIVIVIVIIIIIIYALRYFVPPGT